MNIIGWVRVGDKAACGGTVVEGSTMEISNGRGYTFQGAQMACRKNCRIADGYTRATLMNGRPRVLHGGMTSAGCPLISTLNDIDGIGNAGGSEVAERYFLNAAGAWTPANEQSAHTDPYDEQPQLVDAPVAGVPYFVETMDGRTFSGTAIDGILPRVDTIGEDEYAVCWGDEALAKLNGIKP